MTDFGQCDGEEGASSSNDKRDLGTRQGRALIGGVPLWGARP